MGDDDRGGEGALWRYFRDVRTAVSDGNRGASTHPYRRGTFLVDARAGDLEVVVSGVTEEDAVLIASELAEAGVRAVVRATLVCPSCGERVPDQTFCTHCRARLRPDEAAPTDG